MGMRSDCRHYFRRTGASGETTEQCDVGAAPDAPLRCPDACPRFEARKLSTIGFDYGSLDAARSRAAASEDAAGSQGDDDVDALFAQLRDVVDEVADTAVADEAERRRAEAVREQRRRRRRIR